MNLWRRIRLILVKEPETAYSLHDIANRAGESVKKVYVILERMRLNMLLNRRPYSNTFYFVWYTIYEKDYSFAEFWKLGR